MKRTVEQRSFESQKWVSRKHTVLHLLFYSFVDRRNVFTWHRATDDFVDELESLSTLVFRRLKAHPHVAVLPTATRLANKFTFNFSGISDSFAIRHLRLADICLNTEFTTHTVDDDVQVKLAHSRNNRLTRFFVCLDSK